MSFSSHRLSDLLEGIATVDKGQDAEVIALTQDSRDVSPGGLFVALKGIQQHGLAYADDVLGKGAAAIIWESDDSIEVPSLTVPMIEVTELRQSLGIIANRFYGAPSQQLNVIGITGTDGKTTVSHFIAQALTDCAVIGTLGMGRLNDLDEATHTTPDVLSVHENLAKMQQKGVRSVAMEVSSHALDQGRVKGIDFKVAVLTNLTRDHLDYHGTLDAYRDAKAKLFSWVGLQTAVLNLDDAFGQKLLQKWGGVIATIGYGIGKAADYPQKSLIAENASFTAKGIKATIVFGEHKGSLQANVLGYFNLSNLLAAMSVLLALDIPFADALEKINRVQTVAGRMEKVADSSILVVVDYAHTPNALETVLKALREHTGNKLICVFGCGGDRDKGKRPLMARIAEKLADGVIVTDDNPRTENPQAIVEDILEGFNEPHKVEIIHDRANAISQAIKQAQQGDTVLIAGKGHENVQILASETVPFCDRELARNVLQELAA